ncbi:MAG: hypothetical protein FWB76_03810 [Oscillospiraceae bacterium]|nr:hypothetical protein [Oscillospiraceae bacterium]
MDEWWIWLPILLLLIIVFWESKKKKRAAAAAAIQRIRNRKKEDIPMSDALQRFVGCTCRIHVIGKDAPFIDDVKAIDGHWMTMAVDGGKDYLINTDLIIDIVEVLPCEPRKKRKER